MKVLVVYYSRSGNTRAIAEAVAERLGADIEVIRDDARRGGLFGFFRSGREAWRERPADIAPSVHDPADYDIVVIGTPVWASNMSSPARAYIERHRSRLGRIALFCTVGGMGADKALFRMEALADRTPVASLAVTERDFKEGADKAKVAAFADAIQQSST